MLVFILIAMFLVAAAALPIVNLVRGTIARRKATAKHDEIAERLMWNTQELSPQELKGILQNPGSVKGTPHENLLKQNGAGVYILLNKTKGLHFIGQGKHVVNRAYSNFTGKGSPDVFTDFKAGDDFTIKIIPFEGSGFETLDELERFMLAKFSSAPKQG